MSICDRSSAFRTRFDGLTRLAPSVRSSASVGICFVMICFIPCVGMGAGTQQDCTAEQRRARLVPKIEVLPEEVGSVNHGAMDEVLITARTKISGLELSSMELTRGEVSEFFVPLAFVRAGETATATFSGYRSEIESFELLITYSSDSCTRATQTMVYRRGR